MPPLLARPWLWLLGLTGARLAIATLMPLAPDEAYYWVWSRALAPGYLDHPPMVALWIHLGTALAGDTPFGIRLLAPLCAALGAVLLVRAGDDLLPGRNAGLIAAILLNSTLLFGVGAVTMTPDTPVLFFWTVTLFALARLVAAAALSLLLPRAVAAIDIVIQRRGLGCQLFCRAVAAGRGRAAASEGGSRVAVPPAIPPPPPPKPLLLPPPERAAVVVVVSFHGGSVAAVRTGARPLVVVFIVLFVAAAADDDDRGDGGVPGGSGARCCRRRCCL